MGKKITMYLALFVIVNAMVMCSNANALEVGASAGTVNKLTVGGLYIKSGKYTLDGHIGSELHKKATAISVTRELIDFSELGLKIGVGLSANKSEVFKNRINTKRVYQGYDLDLNYKAGKINIRSTINSNGDVKAGIGFDF